MPTRKKTAPEEEPSVPEDKEVFEQIPVQEEIAVTASANSSAGKSKPVMTIHLTRRGLRYLVVLIVVLIAFLAAAWTFHWWNWGLTAQQVQQRETAVLVQKVGQLMLLPAGETPVIATVTNASALKKNQAFYANAKNGDVLMVYTKAGRAILFRPSENKIINVGPVYLNQSSGKTGATTVPQTSANAPVTATTTVH